MSRTESDVDERALRAALGLLADSAPPPATTDLQAAAEAWRAAPPSRLGRVRAIATRPLLLAPVALAAVLLAVSTVLAVLPGSGWVVRPAAPAQAELGLPARWWTPPAWTPSVVDHPIESASLVLSVDGMVDDGLNLSSGAVLVSGDGREYRRLPWRYGPDQVTSDHAEGAVALSSDGRWVAWAETRPEGGPTSTSTVPRAYVHLLRLADGHERVVALAADGGLGGDHVDRILWSGTGSEVLVVGGEILLGDDDTSTRVPNVYRLPVEGDAGPELLCRGCGVGNVAALPDGRWLTSPDPDLDDDGVQLPGGVPVPADRSAQARRLGERRTWSAAIGASEIVALPDGSGFVGVAGPVAGAADPSWRAGVMRAGAPVRSFPVSGAAAPENVHAEVFAATPERALVALNAGPGEDEQGSWSELVTVDLRDGTAGRVGAAAGRGTEVVGVAPALAAELLAAAGPGAGVVPGEEPAWPWYQRERITDRLDAWSGTLWAFAMITAAGLAGWWVQRWMLRRRSPQNLHSVDT